MSTVQILPLSTPASGAIPAAASTADETPDTEAAYTRREDLLDTLGLGDHDATTGTDDALAHLKAEAGQNLRPASPTAILADEWGQRRGQQLADEVQADRTEYKAKKDAKAAKKAAKAGTVIDPNAAVEPDKNLPTANELTDFHALAFEPTISLAERCTVPERLEYVKQLVESPDVAEVRHSTVGNTVTSEIAARTFADRWVVMATENNCRNPEGGPKTRPSPGPGSGRPTSKKDVASAVDMMKAVAGAAKAAKEEANGYNDACDALGCGGGGAGEGGKIDPASAVAAYKRVRNSKTLRKIAEAAGRFRRMAAAKQRMKTSHGIDETIGVTIGSDISRLTTVELSRLADPVLSDDVMYRIAEGKAQLLERRGHVPAGKGPVVVVVDESGSMGGEKVQNAKALALALAWVARKQKRWTALVGFSGGTQGNILMLPPGRWNEQALCDWLEHFYGGGTDADVPMKEIPEEMWPRFIAAGAQRGKTDMVIITDGEIDIPDEIEAGFKAWRLKEQVKVFALMLESQPGQLDRCVDEIHRLKNSDLRPEGEAVGNVLSI